MANLDILDKNGLKTGKIKPKAQIHADGDWHRSVHIWIINDKGELLIQKRSPNKDSYPNTWDISAAGHVDAGEDSETAAMREIEEEIGIKFSKKDLKLIFSLTVQSVLNNGTFFNNEFDDIYLLHSNLNISEIKMQESEVSEVKFINWMELEKHLRNSDSEYVPKTVEYYDLLFGAIKNEKRDPKMSKLEASPQSSG